jgi:hypothetical protein
VLSIGDEIGAGANRRFHFPRGVRSLYPVSRLGLTLTDNATRGHQCRKVRWPLRELIVRGFDIMGIYSLFLFLVDDY